MTKRLLRVLRLAPLALLFAGIASAQTTGTIIGVVTDASTGKPVAGAVVIATSPNMQGEQTAVTDGNGNYRLVQLPPGEYKLAVQLEGYKPFERSDIIVRLDRTIRTPLSVVPEAVQMEEQVVRTGAAPVVNVGSAESGAVVSQEFMSSVPMAGRGFEAIAVVAPTARVDTYGISFAGAQSPENQYIIDGLNTTDPALGTRAGRNGPPALRSNFVQELDIKTGGFGAEYGRATGGILNVVLNSGSNEFHGSVFSTFTPNLLVEPTGNTIAPAGEAIAFRSKASEGAYALDFGAEVGGPILKDKLWFYAGIAPVYQKNTYERFFRQNVMPSDQDGDPLTAPTCPAGYSPDGDVHGATGQCVNAAGDYLQTDVAGSSRTVETSRTTYQWVGKLTYLLNENNNITVTGWGAPSSRSALGGGFAAGGTLYAAPSNQVVYTDDSQTSIFGRWNGKFLDKRLITEVQSGWYSTTNTPVNKTVAGINHFDTPSLEWLEPLNVGELEGATAGACGSVEECPVYGYTTGGRGGNFKYTTNRFVAKASASYLFDALGQHTIKGGIDLERLDYDATSNYTGGAYYTASAGLFSAFRGFGTITNASDPSAPLPVDGTGTKAIEISDFTSGAYNVSRATPDNKSETDSFAYFIQDSWQPAFLPTLTLNYGIRLETQSMKNLDFPDATGFEINDNWSPRVQAIWDFTGTGRGKVAGNWGRFYYAMPLDMGNRAFGSEISLRYNLDQASCGFDGNVAGYDPKNVQFPFSGTTTGCSLVARGTNAAAGDIRLTGGSLTPADDGLKGQFVDQFGAQVEYEVLPDLSVGIGYQGRRQGDVIEDMSSNDGGDYYIGNPGIDRDIYLPDGTFAGNSKYVDSFDVQTGRTVQIEFPKPERSYDGVTLSATKLFSKNWLASASYTYSVLRGNYPGPFRPEDGQLDPGITSEYDLANLMANKKGYLPGDQTHQFKLYGAYTWNFGPRFNVTAGGAYTGVSGTPVNALGAHPDYGPGQAFIIPRGQGGRTPFVNTFDLSGGVGYVIRAPYAVNFKLDIFNVFNDQTTVQADEDYTFDAVAPIPNLDCSGRDSAGDGIAALQADCPGLAYLRTVDGREVSINPNWGKAARATTAFNAPLSMRFSLSLAF